MSWQRLEEILMSSTLDRETKLTAIDLIALSPDPKLVDEVIQLLTDWKSSDDQAQDIFKKGIKKITLKYKQQEELAENETTGDVNEIIDTIKAKSKIQDIKEKIEKLPV